MERGETRQELAKSKLLRISVACRSGNAAGAELELYSWVKQDDAPASARVMLAAMWARRGQEEEAKNLLQDIYDQDPASWDLDEVQLLISLLITCDLKDAAKRLGNTLYESHGENDQVARWLRTMFVPGANAMPYVHKKTVKKLAAELKQDMTVLPSLVYALRHEPRAKSVVMLRQSLLELVDKLDQKEERLVCFCGLAELAMLSGDQSRVRYWAEQGLEIDPYHARLALLLSETEQKYAANIARKRLALVSRKHPEYPDVRSALIRQKFADGKTTSAKRKLDGWLKQEPESEIAQRLRMKFSSHYEQHQPAVTSEGVAA